MLRATRLVTEVSTHDLDRIKKDVVDAVALCSNGVFFCWGTLPEDRETGCLFTFIPAPKTARYYYSPDRAPPQASGISLAPP